MCRWRVPTCTDDDIENDPSQKVDDADEEDDGEREAKWRMERLEREKFLEEHQVVAVFYLQLCQIFTYSGLPTLPIFAEASRIWSPFTRLRIFDESPEFRTHSTFLQRSGTDKTKRVDVQFVSFSTFQSSKLQENVPSADFYWYRHSVDYSHIDHTHPMDWVLSQWVHFTVHSLDLFVFICVYFVFLFFILHICCVIVSTVGWT